MTTQNLQEKIVAVDAFLIAKSDTVDFIADTTNNTKGYKFARVYVGGTGNVKILTSSGTTVTFFGVPAGITLPVLAQRVFSTDTTATNMTAVVSL